MIFVCGPFGRRPLLEELVERFRGLSFAAPLQPALPVTAVLLAQPQAEYGGGLHGAAAEAIARLPDLRPTAPFHTDTDLIDADRIRGAGEATSLIARADAVVTTRPHGMVLSLRQGVPTVAIDAIPGGAKVTRQAAALGWPAALRADELSDEALGKAWDFCLTDEAVSERVSAPSARAGELGELERSFVAALAALP